MSDSTKTSAHNTSAVDLEAQTDPETSCWVPVLCLLSVYVFLIATTIYIYFKDSDSVAVLLQFILLLGALQLEVASRTEDPHGLCLYLGNRCSGTVGLVCVRIKGVGIVSVVFLYLSRAGASILNVLQFLAIVTVHVAIDLLYRRAHQSHNSRY